MRKHLNGPPIGVPWRINLDSPQAIGLQSWFPITVGSFYDVVGIGMSGVPVGGPRVVKDSLLGHGLEFTGANYMQLWTRGESSAANTLYGMPGPCGVFAPITIMMWINTTTPATRQAFMGDWNATGNHLAFSAEIGGYLQPAGNITANLGGYLDSGVNAVANTWYHVAMTYGPSQYGTLQIYINGVLKNSGGNRTIDGYSIGRGTLGRGGDYNSMYMLGMVSDVRFYRGVLPANVIAQIYNPATRWELYDGMYIKSRSTISVGTGRKYGPAAQVM